MKISFIDEKQLFQQNLKECPICKKQYLKFDFIHCDKCSTINCLNCMYLAGNLGKFCVNCFKSFPTDKKKQISKKAGRLRFLAKYGYYMFIFLLSSTIFSFSFTILNFGFFVVGIIIVIPTILFGYFLVKTLSKS